MTLIYKFCIVCLLVMIGSTSYAQKKMVLHFKDGSQQTGYVTFKKKEIQFQENRKDKKEKIDYALLDSAVTAINSRAKRARKPKTVYVLATYKDGKDYRVYDLIKQGKVNLYTFSNYSGVRGLWAPTGGNAGNSVFIPTGGASSTIKYGLKRENETYVTILDKFVKNASNYFKDCSELSEKIKKKEKGFKKENIKKIVDYYNSQCAKK